MKCRLMVLAFSGYRFFPAAISSSATLASSKTLPIVEDAPIAPSALLMSEI